MNTRPGAIIIEGHVQGLSNVRSLGERGIPVYVVDVNDCLARYSRFCVKFFKCPPFSSEDFIRFLIGIGQKENLNGWVLIPSNDHIVMNLSRHRTELSPYFSSLAPSPQMLDLIVNKRKLLERAASAGVDIPATCYAVDEVSGCGLRYPVLLKGIYGLSFYKAVHSKGFRADSFQELKRQFRTLPEGNVLIQELIPEPEHQGIISFTCFAVDGCIKAYWMGEKMREHPVKYGTATFSRSILVPEILKSAERLIPALGYTGVCEVEYMYDNRDGAFKLIEINPRTWLWVGLAKACGVDYAGMIYDYLNGSEIVIPSSYPTGVKWINGITDLFFSVKGVFDGVYSLSEYMKSLRGRKVRAVWSWNDPLPGLAYPLLSFYIFRKRR